MAFDFMVYFDEDKIHQCKVLNITDTDLSGCVHEFEEISNALSSLNIKIEYLATIFG